ncbi:hypothetical protein ABZ545_32195 [Streptomyces abikoensis]|uniref:hypothetical protein n=1 Tax=Streptomyces abikoensis TaxID=97398 RepID=UPI0033F057BD
MTTLPFTPVLARPLPHTVTPFPNETLTSYFYRLARVNRSEPRIIRVPSRWLPCSLNDLELLEVLSGQPRVSLVWAIPELRRYAPHIARPPKNYGVLSRLACSHCTARSGSTIHIRVHVRGLYQNVCVRHRLWLTAGAGNHHQQINLRHAPEVVRAQIAINRLVRRHGEQFIADCYRECGRFWGEVDRRGIVRSEAVKTLSRLVNADHLGMPLRHEPISRFRQAARFPQLTRFTIFMASLVFRDPGTCSVEVTEKVIATEFERVFPFDYRPRSVTGPWLRSTLLDLLSRMEARARNLGFAEGAVVSDAKTTNIRRH